MNGKIVEIKIAGMALENKGSIKGGEDTIMVNHTLVYPGPGKPTVTTVKTYSTSTRFPLDSADLSYSQSVVFKEQIFGDCQLIVEVLAVDNPSKFEKFVTKVFKSVLTVAVGNVTGGISNVFLGAAAGTAVDTFMEQIKADEHTQAIGSAAFDFNAGKLPDSGFLESALKVPADVIIRSFGSDPLDGSGPTMKEEVILKAGSHNGAVKMAVTALN
ncbi:MAG: hypothetical protein OEZ55_07560 [Nitrospinota bacterium]|nr:hypothetical protein [Nitrospinota bacterium]MDH5756505.1 hypothetical protein [Nitrospinota bacterium]